MLFNTKTFTFSVTGNNGTIEEFYPEFYPVNYEKIFHIEVEPNAKIELDIIGVEMEYHWNCSYDFIQGIN